MDVLGRVVPILARDGWLLADDVCALERTCRTAKTDWCTDEGVWKPLAVREWPLLRSATTPGDGEDNEQAAAAAAASPSSLSYKAMFCDRHLWLAAEVERVKALPKWNDELTHNDVECGRCGCNCTEGKCGGIPITTEFRWEKKDQEGLCWPDDRQDVPDGLGYEESGGTMIRMRRFCEPCFDLLVENSILKTDDYEKVRGETLFDAVTKEMIEATTELQNQKRRPKNSGRFGHMNVYYEPFFSSGSEWSWQEMHKNVKADDVAVVVANALIQEGCQTRYLQLDGIHYNDPGFGPKGYKALAFALSINTTVERIDFYEGWGEACCGHDGPSFSVSEDKSNGFFLKALQHNKESALKDLPLLCPAAFGPLTTLAWKRAKPGLKCGPMPWAECYHDSDYVY